MPAPAQVAYNPSDSVQAAFLAALALGETGGGSGSQYKGVGGSDLSGASVDQYGFPMWAGSGNSHAAGTYQFQPGTWDPLAQTYGLNFSNQADQNAGAWYLAEQTYATQTGGSLEADLSAGKLTQIQSALQGIWPSVTGNGAAPQGLAHSIANGLGVDLAGLGGSGAPSTDGSSGGGWITTVENFFVRFGLIILGGIIVIAALWLILSDQGILPSPGATAKLAATAL